MNLQSRNLELDIFDYSGNKLCSLYSNKHNISGMAYNIKLGIDRNGWQEFNFEVPYLYFDGEKEVKNFRVDYLRADYKLRAITDDGIEWYIITNPSVQHKGKKVSYSITANHVAQFLKFKNLDLIFSDDEGNNIGTAEELLTTILQGTDWQVGEVAEFLDLDGSVKVRSLSASEKTGAFKLISQMCDLFDAKPIYRSHCIDEEGNVYRRVDILPMNPFVTDKLSGDVDFDSINDVIEIHYGTNMNSISKQSSTENLVTKLYAYGSYGDKTHGYCSLQECWHDFFEYTMQSDTDGQSMYSFDAKTLGKIDKKFYIQPDSVIYASDILIFSMIDPSSMMFLWNDTQKKAYRIISDRKAKEYKAAGNEILPLDCARAIGAEQNWVNYVMDFDYYESIGLITDEMIQALAEYHATMADEYENLQPINENFAKKKTELAKIIGSVDFLKLNYVSIADDSGFVVLNCDEENWYQYRTDEDEKNIDKFTLKGCLEFDPNGDPIPGKYDRYPSIAYIVHTDAATGEVTYNKVYLKNAYDDNGLDSFEDNYMKNDKSTITAVMLNMRTDNNIIEDGDDIYIFDLNNINGYLGALEAKYESTMQMLDNKTTISTMKHPCVMRPYDPDNKPDKPDAVDMYPQDVDWYNVSSYGWWYNYKTENMFFYSDLMEVPDWTPVYIDRDGIADTSINYNYKFDCLKGNVYKKNGEEWLSMVNDKTNNEISFWGTVYNACLERDLAFKGEYKTTVYECRDMLPPGEYYFKGDFGLIYVFSTVKEYGPGVLFVHKKGESQNDWIDVIEPIGGDEEEGFEYEYDLISETIRVKTHNFDNVGYAEEMYPDKAYEIVMLKQGEEVAYQYLPGAYTNKDGTTTYTVSMLDLSGEGLAMYLPAGTYSISTKTGYICFELFEDLPYRSTITHEKDMMSITIKRADDLKGSYDEWCDFSVGPGSNYKVRYGAQSERAIIFNPTGEMYNLDRFVAKNISTVLTKDLKAGTYYFYEEAVNAENNEYKYYRFSTLPKSIYHSGLSVKINADHSVLIGGALHQATECDPNKIHYTTERKIIDEEDNNIITSEGTIYIKDIPYTELAGLTHSLNGEPEERHGIDNYIVKFRNTADDIYINLAPEKKRIESEVNEKKNKLGIEFGDLLREGYWQDTSYVDGDEDRLYQDALENIVEASKPEDQFNISFKDRFANGYVVNPYDGNLQEYLEYADANSTEKGTVSYNSFLYTLTAQDLSITFAVHLIDETIGINQWAYIDHIDKHFDQPQNSSIKINTKLSTITQHSFTDVMGTIAKVATEYKGKSTVYAKTPIETYTKNVTVDENNIPEKAITSSKISSLDGFKIEEGSIGSAQIGDATITVAKIADLKALGDSLDISANKSVTIAINNSVGKYFTFGNDGLVIGKKTYIEDGKVVKNPWSTTVDNTGFSISYDNEDTNEKYNSFKVDKKRCYMTEQLLLGGAGSVFYGPQYYDYYDEEKQDMAIDTIDTVTIAARVVNSIWD